MRIEGKIAVGGPTGWLVSEVADFHMWTDTTGFNVCLASRVTWDVEKDMIIDKCIGNVGDIQFTLPIGTNNIKEITTLTLDCQCGRM